MMIRDEVYTFVNCFSLNLDFPILQVSLEQFLFYEWQIHKHLYDLNN